MLVMNKKKSLESGISGRKCQDRVKSYYASISNQFCEAHLAWPKSNTHRRFVFNLAKHELTYDVYLNFNIFTNTVYYIQTLNWPLYKTCGVILLQRHYSMVFCK